MPSGDNIVTHTTKSIQIESIGYDALNNNLHQQCMVQSQLQPNIDREDPCGSFGLDD